MQCDAAFKQGGKFAGWTTGAADDAYYHPSDASAGVRSDQSRAALDARNRQAQLLRFRDPPGRLCDEGLAPKLITSPEYRGLANYSYHLDAGKFAPFLARHCTEKLGVRHVLANVVQVNQSDSGDIQSVLTPQAGEISGDLFIDCSGFSALLIGKTLGVGFKDCSDVLFCDTALAAQVPYETPDAPMASQTIATAQEAGWIWDIGLPTRRGVGYVYSSRHSSEEAARETLQRYIGPQHQDLPVRKIPIRSGHRQTFWKNNCIAVGLAGGFLEPLESSAIVLVELSAKLIAEQMPANRRGHGHHCEALQ